MPSGRYYTNAEMAIVRELFPTHGAKLVATRLGRSPRAVAVFAHKHGIRRDVESWKAIGRDRMAKINAGRKCNYEQIRA